MNFKKLSAAIIIAALTVLIIPSGMIRAASASVIFESEEGNDFCVGDEIKVGLVIEADAFLGEFHAYLSYSEMLLEYVKGPDCIVGDDGLLRISDEETDIASDTRKYVLTFRATARGTARINLLSGPEIYELETGYMMSASTGELYLQIEPSETASEEGRLESLKISPSGMIPAFSPDTYEYTLDVSAETEQVFVSADPMSEGAEVRISGDKELFPGKNRVVVTVVAESGDETNYMIIVNRTGETGSGDMSQEDGTQDGTGTPGETGPGEEAAPNARIRSFGAEKSDDGVITVFGGFDYKVVTPGDGTLVPDGYKKTSIIIDGVSIPAYAEKNAESDFLLLYLACGDNEPEFYSYDRTEKTIQRFAGKNEMKLVRGSNPEITDGIDTETLREYESNQKRTAVILGILCAASAAMLLFAIKLFLVRKKEIK